MSALSQNISPEASTRNAAIAWESFVGTGKFTRTIPREIIQNSWQQSYTLGINPESTRAPTLMSADEVAEQIQIDDVAKASIPSLNKLSDSLRGNQFVVVLADACGQIVYSSGHDTIREQLEEINFRPGASWNEEEVGPNGIGTPLALGRPELVLGTEHYCRGWQPYVCYGAPIKDPFTNKTVGVVDITGISNQANTQPITTVISIAESIQARLAQHYLIKREELRSVIRPQIVAGKDALLLFDKQGALVDYNDTALALFNINPARAVELNIQDSFPEFAAAFQRCLKHSASQEVRTALFNSDENWRVVLEPVKQSSHNIGVLFRVIAAKHSISSTLNLEQNDETSLASDKMVNLLNELNGSDKAFNLKEINDEIIQYAIDECKGNISRAALMLGINRTTIYRHLKSKTATN